MAAWNRHCTRLACCAAFADERLGERVCAVVALREGQTLTLEEVCDHLRAADIATYKLPEKLRIIEALPRNPLGKVLRRELRKSFWEGRERMVG